MMIAPLYGVIADDHADRLVAADAQRHPTLAPARRRGRGSAPRARIEQVEVDRGAARGRGPCRAARPRRTRAAGRPRPSSSRTSDSRSGLDVVEERAHPLGPLGDGQVGPHAVVEGRAGPRRSPARPRPAAWRRPRRPTDSSAGFSTAKVGRRVDPPPGDVRPGSVDQARWLHASSPRRTDVEHAFYIHVGAPVTSRSGSAR